MHFSPNVRGSRGVTVVAMSRQLRGLVIIEAALVLVACVAPLPVPAAVPLLVVASFSLWLRGRSWAEVTKGPAQFAAIGAAAGALALALALALGTPAIEAITDYAVQWSMQPVVRGNVATFAIVAVIVAASAAASELVLRGWIVERVLGLPRARNRRGAERASELELRRHRILAVIVGALAEALLADGSVAMRIGAGLFGLGLGWMYIAGGRSVVAPICARLAFSLGALALEATRVVG